VEVLFSFTPQLLYPWVKKFLYALSGRLGGLRSKIYILEKRKISCSYQESKTPEDPACSLVTLLTKPSLLPVRSLVLANRRKDAVIIIQSAQH
jgi:hypothetical protein